MMSEISAGSEKQNDILPEEFVQFLSKNYKTINDIERKVQQFQNDSWGDFYKKLGCRDWRNMRLRATKYDSVDSCFSDKDIKKVIRAKLKPKLKKLESNEQIEIYDDVFNESGTNKRDVGIDYTYLLHSFPLAYFSPDLCNAGTDETQATRGFSTVISQFKSSSQPPIPVGSSVLVKFMVEGSRYPLIQRVSSTSVGKTKDRTNCLPKTRVDESLTYQINDYSSDDGSHGNTSNKKTSSSKETSPTRRLLTLTLPPLHQSVLTLLGQKSGVKSSPRNHVIHELGTAFDSSSNNQKAKLRRHGRKKKTKEEGKESEEKEVEKPDAVSTTDNRGDNDELQETQINTLQNEDDLEVDEMEEMFFASSTYIKEIKSLRDVLDGHLCKDQWSQKEMETLSEEIQSLSVGLQKYQTEFKSKSITIGEDAWLAFPRTCTHTTATFGVPSNSKILNELTSVDYLKNYVGVAEPRLHLYNLIYQRYRILENPTGTVITVKSLQRALTEVLGRPFNDEEMTQLKTVYLNVEDNFELDTKTFAGICAFTERIYGKYVLEKRDECIVCSKHKGVDKERCHVKRKSPLENMDLSFFFNKIRFTKANPGMTNLIQVLAQVNCL